MKTGLLKRTISDLTLLPLGTTADRVKELQARRMLTKGDRGRYGGVIMSPTDRVNALLACLFDSADIVKRTRRLPLGVAFYNPTGPRLSFEDNARCAFQLVEALGIKFDDLGTALDAVVQSIRTGVFERWVDGTQVSVSVDFHGDSRAILYFDRPQFNKSAVFEFFQERPKEAAIERFVRLNTTVFERLAVDESHGN